MISKLRIENFKALRDVSIDLTPLHVLIGPNNSGKTSILEALNALCRSADFPLAQAFPGHWKGYELIHCGSNKDVIITADFLGDDGRDNFQYLLGCRFHAEPQRQAVVAEEAYHQGTHQVSFSNQGQSKSHVFVNHQNGGAGTAEQQDAAKKTHRYLSGVHYYRWDARQLALPVAPDSSRRFRMDQTGFGLALCLDDILGYDRERFMQMEARFRVIFPEIASIKLLPEPAYKASNDPSHAVPLLNVTDGKGIYFQFADSTALVPASQASDGVLMVLAYLTVLNLPTPPRVLLVEEPENGIHPGRLQDVLKILRDSISERSSTQVLLTTHSPYVVDLFSPDEVTLCRRENEQIVTKKLSESKMVRDQLDVFSLGEIWTSEGDERIASAEPVGGAAS
jgi:predicted ATPase